MIKKYSLRLLQKAINTTFALDNSMQERVNTLYGKVICIIITPLNTRFFIKFDQKLILLDDYPWDPDTTIYSNPIGLIKLSCLPISKTRSLFNDDIKIIGDTELGLQVKRLFDKLDIDWEGHLARFTGDVVACQLGTFARWSVEFGRKITVSMRNNITEYLQEELQLLPPPEELNDFYNNIYILTQDIERLHAQINWLIMYYDSI